MRRNMKKSERIAITGVGPLTSCGSGNAEVWKSILAKRTGLVRKEYTIDGESLGAFYVHEVQNFDIKDYDLNRNVLNEINCWKNGDEIIDLHYFLAVVKMALDDSLLQISDGDKDSIGLVLAHENMGLDHFYWKVINELSFFEKDSVLRKPSTKKEFLLYFYNKFHRTGYELQTFMALRHVAKVFDIHGFSLFLNNACASSLYALEAAADAIRSGKCRQMVVAAVDRSSIFKHIWFRSIDMLAKDGRIKPFSSDRDGFTLGDGGAAFVLEDMEGAVGRKANIYAEYVCGSFILEGWKVAYPDITNDIYKNMILKLIDKAGLTTHDIDLVIPHAVGTDIADKYESVAINRIFGDNDKLPVISAFKPYIGHTLGSSAILETAIMLIGLKNGIVPPTLNCEKPCQECGIDLLRENKKSTDIRFAMKSACGFAGFDGACILGIQN